MADLCRELPSRGWDTVLGLTRGARFHLPDVYRAVHQDLPTVEVDGTFGTRAARVRSLKDVIRKTSPDVVLSMRVFDAYEAVSQLKATDLCSAPRLIAGIRAFESPYISDLRRCHANIDFCATSGNLIAEACCRFGHMEPERVDSIGGGISQPVAEIGPRTVTSRVRLLYAGRLEQAQKRVFDLIEFVQCLMMAKIDFHLDVCGSGPDESTVIRGLQPQIDAGRVTIHGWVSQDDLYSRFYPTADCFIHFAAWEGITISPREAMSHGVVPIISEFTGLHAEKQFLNGINALTFPVGRPDLAADRIKTLMSNPGLYEKLSRAARLSQAGRYSFDGAIDAWRDLLNRCLALPAKSGPFPSVPERLTGRLSRLGVPLPIQIWARRLLNKPIAYSDPGSEWPTASGLMTVQEEQEIAAFGKAFEDEQKLSTSPHQTEFPAESPAKTPATNETACNRNVQILPAIVDTGLHQRNPTSR